MFLPTLPITDIALILAPFVAAIILAYQRSGYCPDRRRLAAYSIGSLVLTFLSMLAVGSRGGLPPADIYGWPKEFLLIRDGERVHGVGYFLIDIGFYLTCIAAIDSVRRMLMGERASRALPPSQDQEK